MNAFTGYDGSTYNIGSRVELHPGMDLWMRGARFGTVIGSKPDNCALVQLDKLPNRRVSCSADMLRAA